MNPNMQQQHPAGGTQAYPNWGFAQGGGGSGFLGDPTAQMGFNLARTAMSGGTDLAEKNLNRYLTSIKPYFAVTNTNVLKKLYILLNPWRRHPWSRQSAQRGGDSGEVMYLPPRDDLNAPDMYIPLMSLVTYILLSALLYGLSGTFHPELLGYTATSALAAVGLEILGLKLGCYLLSIGNSQLLDLVAYSGYKFVGTIISIVAGAFFGSGLISWLVFLYCFNANAFFLLRSLKYVLLPDASGANVYGAASRGQKQRRSWFLFGYSYLVQFVFMLALSSGVGKAKP